MTVVAAEVAASLDRRYPRRLAADWDRVGPVLGRPDAAADRVLLAVDCVPETVAEAESVRARYMVVHHPLLLRGVSSLDPRTYKGAIVHSLIEAGIGLFVAHTNADSADPGVSDALARRLGLEVIAPLAPRVEEPGGIGRVCRLREPLRLEEFARRAAELLPGTAAGVRYGGDPDRLLRTVAVCGGAGDSCLDRARDAEVDAYLTADLRHHPAGEYLADEGPALLDAAHWATERPWLDQVAAELRADLGVETVVSDRNTDPWTAHAPSRT